jgi:hypothetical protein
VRDEREKKKIDKKEEAVKWKKRGNGRAQCRAAGLEPTY